MDAAQRNLAVVEAALGEMIEGRPDAALTRFEEDARWGVARSLTNAGLHQGRVGIRAYLGSIQERMGGRYRMLHLNVYGTQDHVFAELTRTPGEEAYAEGAEHVMLSFHVVMGRIREVREFVYAIR